MRAGGHPGSTAFSGTVEFRRGFAPPIRARHALFDFDGTLSLVRSGWPPVMLGMFLELIPPRAGEDPVALRRELLDELLGFAGRQTIDQMARFAERVAERGGRARHPDWYKAEFLRRLERLVDARVEDLRSGRRASDELLVPGARRALQTLTERGLTLHLASGTDEAIVRRDAELLDIAHFFGGRIDGARPDPRAFSKAMVIARILDQHRVDGAALLAFGDGPVEIADTKRVGGHAVAVASDEDRPGSGAMDAWKRERLLSLGADVAIPDYRDIDALLDALLGRTGAA